MGYSPWASPRLWVLLHVTSWDTCAMSLPPASLQVHMLRKAKKPRKATASRDSHADGLTLEGDPK